MKSEIVHTVMGDTCFTGIPWERIKLDYEELEESIRLENTKDLVDKLVYSRHSPTEDDVRPDEVLSINILYHLTKLRKRPNLCKWDSAVIFDRRAKKYANFYIGENRPIDESKYWDHEISEPLILATILLDWERKIGDGVEEEATPIA